MDEIWEILGGLFFLSLLIGGFLFLFGGEREGVVKYDDCRQIVQLKSDTTQKYYKKFTCSYSKTQSGKIMSGECVNISNDNSLLGNKSTCATAYVYEKEQDPVCKNNIKGGILYPYLGYNDNCFTEPQGGETYIDPDSMILPTSETDASINSGVSESLPTEIGKCSKTTVSKIGTRLTDGTTGQDIAGTGSAITYANGGYQVSYDAIQGIEDSLVGDKINLCLISIPTDCPTGDERGKVYSATNLRTGKYWQAQDSEHSCGGA